jgi:hypothetical protein
VDPPSDMSTLLPSSNGLRFPSQGLKGRHRLPTHMFFPVQNQSGGTDIISMGSSSDLDDWMSMNGSAAEYIMAQPARALRVGGRVSVCTCVSVFVHVCHTVC